MSVVLDGDGEPVIVAWRWEPATPGQAIEVRDGQAALSRLRRAALGAGSMVRLRRLAAERYPLLGNQLDDAEVLDRLAREIDRGNLRLVAAPRGSLGTWGDREEAAEAPPASAREAVTELHWITIELLGEDDLPIAGQRYRIELPDGSVREGSLDGLGVARVHGIEQAGSCTVTFPDLDEEAWTKVGTTSVP